MPTAWFQSKDLQRLLAGGKKDASVSSEGSESEEERRYKDSRCLPVPRAYGAGSIASPGAP